jgi:hypothetical protein
VLESGVSKRTGRRVAIALLFAFLFAFVGAATAQITTQLFFRTEPEPFPFQGCRDGLVALHGAVGRAAHAAAGESDVGVALGKFRAALVPEWDHIEGVRKACSANEADARSLDALERLRYAEEHAVRREAGSLEVLRKQVARDLGVPEGAPNDLSSHSGAE